jgi:hypothetical protein
MSPIKIKVTDPNWPVNNGLYDFPFNVIEGQIIEMDGRRMLVKKTGVIQDEETFLILWKAPKDKALSSQTEQRCECCGKLVVCKLYALQTGEAAWICLGCRSGSKPVLERCK